MQNWYNDEDFCRAYNMAVALADRVVELEVEVKWLRTHFCVSASEVSDVPCVGCGGPVIEFVIPSEIWNAVVRGGGPERDDEYLCYACWLAAVYRQSQCIRRLEEENAGLRALGRQQEAVVVNMDPFVEAARCQCGWDSAALVRISGKMTCGSESRS